MTIGQQIPLILFSRIDHRHSHYKGCECQQCSPTLYEAALQDRAMAQELFDASKGGNVPGITENHRSELLRRFPQYEPGQPYRPHPHMNAAESRIVEKLLDDLLAAGLFIRVHDGEKFAPETHQPVNDKERLWSALASTDRDRLFVYLNADGLLARIGWVLLVWGNDYDVISDYTINLAGEGARTGEVNWMAGACELAEQIAAKGF